MVSCAYALLDFGFPKLSSLQLYRQGTSDATSLERGTGSLCDLFTLCDLRQIIYVFICLA